MTPISGLTIELETDQSPIQLPQTPVVPSLSPQVHQGEAAGPGSRRGHGARPMALASP